MCCYIDEYNALVTEWNALEKKKAKKRFAEEQVDLVSARFSVCIRTSVVEYRVVTHLHAVHKQD